MPSPASLLVLCLLSALPFPTHAHSHSSAHVSDSGAFQPPPKPPAVIVAHVILQLAAWGILLPVGFVLGLAGSKLHSAVQFIAVVLLSLPASILPHVSSASVYRDNFHSQFSTFVIAYLISQAGIGVALKSRILEQHSKYLKIKAAFSTLHISFGRAFPLLAWIHILLGGIASLGFCFGNHTGQCLAHFIMGSSFIGYGVFLLLMLQHGRDYLNQHSWSQEYLDCWVITVWGVINTFSEHGVFFSSGWSWSHKDMQHTSLGVFWACAGGLGIHLSRSGQRSVLPGLVVLISGWVFQSHEQNLPFSTKIHGAFGWTLMAAGLVKIIQVSLASTSCDLSSPSPRLRHREDTMFPRLSPFDHLTPLLLVISGVMFMSATEEQLLLILHINMDHATYVLCQVSVGSIIYLYVNLLSALYQDQMVKNNSDTGQNCRQMDERFYESVNLNPILTPDIGSSSFR